MALPHFITFSGFFWRHIASTLAGLIDEARPFLCSALCVLSLVACSHRSFFFCACVCVCVCVSVCVCVCFFCSSLLSTLPFFPVSFLLPFLSWPSFVPFCCCVLGGFPCFASASARRQPSLLFFGFFFLLLGGTLVALASHSSPASAHRIAVGCLSLFRQLPLAGLSFCLLNSLCQLRLAGLVLFSVPLFPFVASPASARRLVL